MGQGKQLTAFTGTYFVNSEHFLWLKKLNLEMLTKVFIEDLFGNNIKNWSPNGHLLGSKSPNPLKFLAFFKKWQQNVTFC